MATEKEQKIFHYSENLAPHSFELSTNSKGQPQWAIKIYDNNIDAAKEQALKIHNELCDRFPEVSIKTKIEE